LVQKDRLPTEVNYFSDSVVQSTYQFGWSPASGIMELYVPEAKLAAGTWYAQVAPQDASRRMAYALTSVIFGTTP
jgi:hypothetical protein